jgi:hypothetical protein
MVYINAFKSMVEVAVNAGYEVLVVVTYISLIAVDSQGIFDLHLRHCTKTARFA